MTEIEKMLSMNYQECIEYMLAKYGELKGDFFVNKNCKTQNKKIECSFEGL